MVQEDTFGGAAARTVSLTQLTLDERLPVCLQEHGERLRFIAAHASKVTRRSLDDEIERIEEVLDALTAARQPKEVIE